MIAARSLRRTLVVVGVALALLVAGLTIRAASLWASQEAPLDAAPITVGAMQAALEQERGRSAALQAQIAELEAASAELEAALVAAQDRLGADQATADGLRGSLAAAQAKLAKLQAALAAAKGGTVVQTSGSTSGGGDGDEDDHEDEDHDAPRPSGTPEPQH